MIQLNSILDYYPCGAYKLTKKGEESICSLHNNLSPIGASNKRLEQLYKHGYLSNSIIGDGRVVEQYMNRNMREYRKKCVDILLLILIFIFIFIFIFIYIV